MRLVDIRFPIANLSKSMSPLVLSFAIILAVPWLSLGCWLTIAPSVVGALFECSSAPLLKAILAYALALSVPVFNSRF
jgi:hypothetical protein